MRHELAALAAALALAACATEPDVGAPPAGRDCFHADSVNGYQYIDEHNVAVRVGANRRYILSTEWNARDLNWEHVIAIRSTTSWICTGNGLGVEIIGGEPHRHYPISAITRAPDETPPQGS
ncbi:MAG: hypothetical protein K2P58_03415 [Hyphomonadaceae bacterium]|nr:hypothetical protein [Hyphomonadaceae bacterium]